MSKSTHVTQTAHDLAMLAFGAAVIVMIMAGLAGDETENAEAAGVLLVKIAAGLIAVAVVLKAVSIGAWLYGRAGEHTPGE